MNNARLAELDRIDVMEHAPEPEEAPHVAPKPEMAPPIAPETEEAPSDVQMEEAEESDVDGVLRGPYPGGPEDSSLLPSFKTHVAAKIWIGKERKVLKLHFHANKFLEWTFPTNETTSAWRDLVRDTGMLALKYFSYISLNRALICAFVER
ncbi:hypothetical protein ACS0TY_018632 [Phlomoides rotata]